MGIKEFFAKLIGMGSSETMERPFAEELKEKEIGEGLKELEEKPKESETFEEAIGKLEEGKLRDVPQKEGQSFPITREGQMGKEPKQETVEVEDEDIEGLSEALKPTEKRE